MIWSATSISPPERGQRLGERGVRWRMEVTVLVTVRVAARRSRCERRRRRLRSRRGTTIRSTSAMWRISPSSVRSLGGHAAVRTCSSVTDLRPCGPGRGAGSRGTRAGCALVLGGELVGGELGHRCVAFGHTVKLSVRAGPRRRWFRARWSRNPRFPQAICLISRHDACGIRVGAGRSGPDDVGGLGVVDDPLARRAPRPGLERAYRRRRAGRRARGPPGERPTRRARRSPSASRRPGSVSE